ncbi:MAG: hypothetical protein ACRYFU_21380 [Janthinobacterium lividum]
MDKQQLAVLAMFGTAVWVIWLTFNAVRQFLAARSQSSAQERLLLRVSSPESLQIFLASPAGTHFLHTLERNPNDVWHGIIRTTQTAVTFAILGVGLLICHMVYHDANGLLPFGIGGILLAIAFGASALVSLAMHRKSGLLPSGRD